MITSLWDYMLDFGKSWFVYPDIGLGYFFVALGMALVFGAFWLCTHWPALFKNRWYIAVAISSAMLTAGAVIFIQVPLQYWLNEGWQAAFDDATLETWLLLVGIPSFLVSGLVQEGAKMVPMVAWWWKGGKKLTPNMGLAIGAVAGAAFGVFEGYRVFHIIFYSGWIPDYIDLYGFEGILGFWERFFAIGFHTSVSALVGWGLAKGKGWQFFLLGSFLHGWFNYNVVFYSKGWLTTVQLETIIAVFALVMTAVVLLIRFRRQPEFPIEMIYLPDEGETPEPPGEEPDKPPAEDEKTD